MGSYFGAILGPPVYYAAAAGVLLLIVNLMMSAGIKFKQAFAVMAYAGLPGILVIAMSVASLFLKSNPDEFNMQNPLPFNLGWFMAPDTPAKFLHSVATSIDLFSFWTMFLIATGLSAAGGKKLKFGGALTAVVIPWALYVLVKSVFA